MGMETVRLLLRPVEIEDYNDIFEYSKNPNVGPSAGWKPHENREETLRVMRDEFLGKENVFAIVLKSENKLIGTAGLIADRKRNYDNAKMLGYSIGEPYWGQGLMTEAARAFVKYGFGELGLTLLSAYCYPFNLSSRRVLEKCGFRYEGLLRLAEKMYDGRILDNLCFSITREEYEEMKNRA